MNVNMLNWRNYKGGADIFTFLLANEMKKHFLIDFSFNDSNLEIYDIIHNHNCYNEQNSDILTIHGLNVLDKALITAKKSSLITCITNYQKDNLEDVLKINIDKVIHNFSDMLYYQKKLLPTSEKPIFAYFGRLCKDKGIDDIYSVSKKINKAKFFLFGFNMNNYQSKDNVYIKSHISNRKALSETIDSVDVVIHPSFEDVHPISVIDAIFRKKPVVSRDLESLRDVFKDYLFYYDNIYELEKYLIEYEDLIYNKKVDKAFNFAFKNFNPIDQSFKYYKIYRYVVE